MKLCKKCNQLKNLSNFHNRKDTVDGKEFSCKECRHKKYKDRYIKTRKSAKTNEQIAEEKRKKYLLNPDRYKEINKRWVEKNREKRNNYSKFYCAKRRAKLASASFSAYDDEIRKIYENCPPGYHVDHIMPLNGRNSCGLHVPWNLQHLPAEANLKKSNKVV